MLQKTVTQQFNAPTDVMDTKWDPTDRIARDGNKITSDPTCIRRVKLSDPTC